MNFDRNTLSHHLNAILQTMDALEKKSFFRQGKLRHSFAGRDGKPVKSLRATAMTNIIDWFHYLVKDVDDINFEIVETYMRLLKANGETSSFNDAKNRLQKAIEPLKMQKIPPEIIIPEFYRLLTSKRTIRQPVERKAPDADIISITRPIDRLRQRRGDDSIPLHKAFTPKTPPRPAPAGPDYIEIERYKYMTERDAEALARGAYLLLRMITSAQCYGDQMSVRRNSHAIRGALFQYFREQKMRKPPSAGTMSAVTKVRFANKADPMDEGRDDRIAASGSAINHYIGLGNVKQEYHELCTLFTDIALRRRLNLPVVDQAHHMLFVGPPGTAKTEIAKCLGVDLYERQVLKKGHFTKVNARDFIGPYLGQTEKATRKILERALGGVLFVDEIYALFDESGNDSYAKAATTMILDFMEEHRHEFILIGAGYPQQVNAFLRSNPGLRDRFKCAVEFPAYSHGELSQIFDYQIKNVYHYTYDPAIKPVVDKIIADELARNDVDFANGRYIRKLVEALERKKTLRLDRQGFYQNLHLIPEDEQRLTLTHLTMADILAIDPARVRTEIKSEQDRKRPSNPIGFIQTTDAPAFKAA